MTAAEQTKPQHTPGPWAYRRIDNYEQKPDGVGYIEASGVTIAHHGDPHSTGLDETVANGNLIAAAPDLLAALVLVLKCPLAAAELSRATQPAGSVYEICRSAIARAQGDTP